jgi:hypothetical protein
MDQSAQGSELPAAPSPPGQYEFSAAENVTLGALAGKMRFVGLFLAVVGVIYLLLAGSIIVMSIAGQGVSVTETKTPAGTTVVARRLGVEHSIGYIIGGLLYLFMGMWTGNSAAAFRRIVDTQGSDIRHLMEAVNNLRKLYTLQYWLILLALIAMAVTLVLVLVMAASR